jgi:hypothetical protein
MRVPGGQVFGEEQAAGIDRVFEIERVGGDRGREKLAVQALAEDPGGSPRAVGAEGVSEAFCRRGDSHIEIISETLKSCKKVVKAMRRGKPVREAKPKGKTTTEILTFGQE